MTSTVSQCAATQPPPEWLLIQSAQQGQREAFDALVVRYQDKVCGVARGLLRDPELARDVVQEAFLRAYTGLSGFRRNDHFYRWLRRITVNLCLDHFRRARRRSTRTHLSFEEQRLDPSEAPVQWLGSDPTQNMRAHEIQQAIGTALRDLPAPQRTALLLREVDGRSYQEIAEEMGCAIGTVMSRLYYARQQMQRALSGYFEEWQRS